MTDFLIGLLDSIAREIATSLDDWPVVLDEGFTEPLDLENCRVASITIIAGGDWQPAHRVVVDIHSGLVLSCEPIDETP